MCPPYFPKSKGQLSFVCCSMEVQFSAWNLLELVSYGSLATQLLQIRFRAAKGKCLARKREIKK